MKKIILLLSNRQKNTYKLLLVLYTISSALDLVGISIVYPFLMVVMDMDSIQNNAVFQHLNRVIKVGDDFFVLIAILFMIAFYVVKDIFQYNVAKGLNKFTVGFNKEMCERLISGYLQREYEFHLNVNSAQLINKINVDVTNVMELLRNMIMLFSDIILFALLAITLFMMYPLITMLLLLGLGIFSCSFFRIYGKQTKRIGDEILIESEKRTKWLMQAFDGVKEIKMRQKESYFADNVNKYTANYFGLFLRKSNIGILPSYLLEVLCVSVILLLVVIGMHSVANTSSFVATMGVFALAAFKLFPKIGALNTEITNIAYGKASLKELVADEESFGKVICGGNEVAKYQFNDNISIEHVSFAYNGSPRQILQDVSMNIHKGEFVGIIGESGAGKSTLVDLLLGLLKPVRGQILIDGKEIDFTNPTWKNMVGYVPQSVFIFDDSIINNIILGEHITEDVENRVIEILKTVQLGDFIKDLPQGIYTEVGERGARISGGQRQRLGLARALYNNPDILVLDEATSALDNSTEEAIMKTINDIKGSCTIIAIAHRLTTVEKCDHIYEVREGRVIAHTAEGVKIFKNKDGK